MSVDMAGFLIFAIAMVGSPGPANMVLMTSGARFGLRRSLPFVAGVALSKQAVIWPVGFGVLTLVQVTEILAKGGDKTGVKAAVGAGSAPAVAAPAAKPAKAAAKPAAKAAAAPAAEGADDLKKLTGVGPKMAAAMAEAGVASFAQMAAWSDDEIAKMDETLSAKGKLVGWVEQAKTFVAEAK